MLPIYKSGVKYLKLSKLDTNGVDRGHKIQNAQSLTLLAPDGSSATYDILSKDSKKDYYMIEINQTSFNNNNLIGSKSDYTIDEYEFEIKRDELIYNPSNPRSPNTPNPGQFNNIFDNSVQQGGGFYIDYPINIIKDENGPNNSPYWNLFSVYQTQETPSLPLEITASIKIDSPNKYEGELVLFKIPYNQYKSGSIPQKYDKRNLISSYVTSFKEWENNFDQSSNYNRHYTTSSFKFTTGRNIGPRVYTLTGVTDLLKNETIGFGLMVKEAPTGSAWDNGTSLVLEDASLKINNLDKEGSNSSFRSSNTSTDDSTFQIIFSPSWTDNNDPDQLYNLDLYNFSDYNPIINNAEGVISNEKYYVVERGGMYSGSIPVPENIDLITYRVYDPPLTPPITYGNLTNFNNDFEVVILAEPSTVSNFNYEQIGTRNARYDGTKYTSGDFNINAKYGLGNSPAEQRTNIFLNCIGAGGQTPEVKDATAFFFNTVIDDKLNIYPSTETDLPQFLDIQDAFAPGLNANVNISALNTNYVAYDGLSGLHKILGIGKVSTLFTTGKGVNNWNYITQSQFQGEDVENFRDFWNQQNYSQATELGIVGGILRAYQQSPWVGENPSTGELFPLNFLNGVGVDNVNFTDQGWQTIPFPNQVIDPALFPYADVGYDFENNTDYVFNFEAPPGEGGYSPEIQFEAKIPIIWFLHPEYRKNGSYNEGVWEPSDSDEDKIVTGETANIYDQYWFNVDLQYRIRLIKGNGDEFNIPIQKFPVSNEYTEYVSDEADPQGIEDDGVQWVNNTLLIKKAIIGSNNYNYSGGTFDGGVDFNNADTPIILRTEPRTFDNGDRIRIEVRRYSGINNNYNSSDYSDGINVVNGNDALKLLKLPKVKNLKLDYFPWGGDPNDTSDSFFFPPAVGFSEITSKTLNSENSHYFKVIYQNPPPTDIINIPDGGWVSLVENLEDTEHVEESGLNIVCLSSELSNRIDTEDEQILDPDQENFSLGNGTSTGYSQEIIIPFIPQPGDQIRFGYDENNTRTIIEIKKLTFIDDFRIYLILDQPLGPIDSDQVNHFIIRRFNKDNTQLTMEVKKIPTPPNAPSGETTLSTITPEFPSKGLSDDFSLIVRNLSNEGVL